MTHGTFSTLDNDRNVPEAPGRKKHDFTLWDRIADHRFFTIFPPFHLAGFVSFVATPVFSKAIPVMGPPIPPSGDMVRQTMDQLDIRALFVPPVIAEQLLKEKNGLGLFKNLEFLCCAGGALSQAVGDQLVQFTDICQYYGSTETFQIQQLVPKKDEWTYMEWHPDCNIEMQATDSDKNVHEMVVKAKPGAITKNAVFFTFPELTEFRTKDLFTQHPHKPQLWRYYGRVDDIIVFSTGEKFNPVPTETTVAGHPLLTGAVVTGNGRQNAVLLVEVKTDVTARDQVLDDIWPLVQKANSSVAGQGRITKSNILLSNPNKPFPRAGKGSVVRKLTEKLYEDEIADKYNNHSAQQGVPRLKPTFAAADVKNYVRETVKSAFAESVIPDDASLLLYGLDSIQALEISGVLKAGLKPYASQEDLEWLTNAFVFAHSSINDVATAISEFLSAGKIPDSRDIESEMEAMMQKYSYGSPAVEKTVSSEKLGVGAMTMVITGTTGTVGRSLLLQALATKSISRVICLNRSSSARSFHEEQLKNTPSQDELARKAAFFTMDISKPRLALTESEYKSILAEANVIVHNAWSTNHELPLYAFEEHIAGTRSLIDLARECASPPHFFFMSSVAATAKWRTVAGNAIAVPESVPSDHRVTSPSGYGASKHVAECVVRSAWDNTDLTITILRVGQVAGSTEDTGVVWPATEWFPILVRSSRAMQALPRNLPNIDFLPINWLVKILLELVTAHDPGASILKDRVLNLVNPNSTPWEELRETVRRFCSSETELIDMEEWLERLRKEGPSADLKRLPALKLLHFFEELAKAGDELRYETTQTTKRSKTFQAVPAIDNAMMEGWLRQWDF